MKELRWDQVEKIHGTIAGISVRLPNVSLLCNQLKRGPYPDRIEGDLLTYYISARSQTHGARKLLQVFSPTLEVRVFEKLGLNRWRDVGYWAPDTIGQQTSDGMLPLRFRLSRSPSTDTSEPL